MTGSTLQAPAPAGVGVSRPTTPAGWHERAEEVATILEADVVEPGRAGAGPYDDIGLLKASGLVTLLGPAACGGAGEHWGTAYGVIRRVAEADGSVGRLLGHHYLWSRLPVLLGTAGQAEELTATATREGWLFGGALDPRGPDLAVVDTGRDLVFSGSTTAPATSPFCDVTWLRAAIDGQDRPVVALAPSDHPGIGFHDHDHDHDHDGRGHPGPRSGQRVRVSVADVVLPWRSALGWVDKQFVGRTSSAVAAPTIGLALTNVQLGIAAGGLRTALAVARRPTVSSPSGADARPAAGDAPCVLDTFGDLRTTLESAQALADEAADAVELLHLDPDGLDPRSRGEVAVLVAAAERRAVDVGQEIGTRLQRVTGAPATTGRVGPGRSRRAVRTDGPQEPGTATRREVGASALLDEVPEPRWST